MKIENKKENQIESILENLKTLYATNYIDRESYEKFLNMLEETLLAEKEEATSTPAIHKESIDQQLERAKNRALAKKLMHSGILYY